MSYRQLYIESILVKSGFGQREARRIFEALESKALLAGHTVEDSVFKEIKRLPKPPFGPHVTNLARFAPLYWE